MRIDPIGLARSGQHWAAISINMTGNSMFYTKLFVVPKNYPVVSSDSERLGLLPTASQVKPLREPLGSGNDGPCNGRIFWVVNV